MARVNGGVVGSYVNTATTTAPGVWSVNAAALRSARINTGGAVDVWPQLADPSFASVVGLYHFNTLIGGVSPVIPDFSASALNLSPGIALNGVWLMNAPKFGLYALNCGGGQRATFASNAAYNFGTGDWTLEGWAYVTTSGSGSTFIDLNGSGGIRPTIYAWTDGTLRLYINSADRITSATSLIILNTWVHWAATHTGTSTKLYYNGNQVGSTYTDSATYTQGSLTIGAFTNNTTIMQGFIDEVRITKGVARYTGSTYTIPTAPFPDY
jgi:hypothetical protein